MGVDEPVAIAVGEKQDGILCRPIGWIDDVRRNYQVSGAWECRAPKAHCRQFVGPPLWPCPRAGVPPCSTEMVHWKPLLEIRSNQSRVRAELLAQTSRERRNKPSYIVRTKVPLTA